MSRFHRYFRTDDAEKEGANAPITAMTAPDRAAPLMLRCDPADTTDASGLVVVDEHDEVRDLSKGLVEYLVAAAQRSGVSGDAHEALVLGVMAHNRLPPRERLTATCQAADIDALLQPMVLAAMAGHESDRKVTTSRLQDAFNRRDQARHGFPRQKAK